MLDSSAVRVHKHGAGRPPTLRLSPGRAADCTKAPELPDGLAPRETVIADKACDTDAGGIAAVPSKATRKTPRELNREAYADRNRIERFFGKIKEFRRVATRYEKRARNYLLRNLAGHSVESTA